MAITVIRTVIIYATLILSMRLMGRRQLGELQPVELVVTLLISDLAVVPMQDSGIPLLSGLVPIFMLVATEILLSLLMVKSSAFASLISGTPMVLIHNGTLNQKTLKKLRMTVEDVSESLRKQNIFDWRDVQTAIAETNGDITVYPVAAKRPIVYEDLAKLPPQDHGIPLVVLADGQYCEWAMNECGVSPQWIDSTLKAEGYQRQDVLILAVNATGNYTLVPKEDVS